MNFEQLIMDYGYLAVIIGTFLEGETILIVAGFAAYEGYLELPLVITAAFFGSLFGDQLYFFIGRYKGQALLARFKSWEPRITRFRKLMDRHNTWFILIFRFLYGLRTPAPFAIGLSNVSIRKFIFLNIISAAIWAVTLGVLGYFFGQVLEAILDDIKKYELLVMGGLILCATVIFWIKRYRLKKARERKALENGEKAAGKATDAADPASGE
ncbi:MAG TPA: DedA family protein [Spirochaetota bacterium]|nr:DedA family protein [Spirochaetota bacterium]HOD14351.1 DedA family protein [Spirochaetota bacterium]HPG51237.1 DedA family protein [Spirochaetota bacterium]HPN12423.1 DedA family protein [Spirochaetota bacterium]